MPGELLAVSLLVSRCPCQCMQAMHLCNRSYPKTALSWEKKRLNNNNKLILAHCPRRTLLTMVPHVSISIFCNPWPFCLQTRWLPFSKAKGSDFPTISLRDLSEARACQGVNRKSFSVDANLDRVRQCDTWQLDSGWAYANEWSCQFSLFQRPTAKFCMIVIAFCFVSDPWHKWSNRCILVAKYMIQRVSRPLFPQCFPPAAQVVQAEWLE